MYEAFYGLREKPFNLVPDPKYLYLSEKHKEAFAHLLFGIKHRSGFVMVTGEIGTGKTTICRTLLNQLDEATEVAFIFNPCLSPEELLRKINEDFGIKTRAATVRGLIDELNAYLLDRNSKGKNCVLVIDEAQNLTPGVLEQIRLLSNLETETQKLLQIVLIGQPELMQLLCLDELRQLNQRITARYHLKALDRGETQQYIAYRLRVAGGRRRIQFSPSAIKLIFKYSQGTPRVINALCDRALLIGYTKETRDIGPDVIHQAAKEIKGEMPKRAWRPSFKRLLPNTTVLATVILLLFAGKYVFDRLSTDPGHMSTIGMAPQTVEARVRDDNQVSVPVQAVSTEGLTSTPAPADPNLATESPIEVEKPAATPPVAPTLADFVDNLDPTEIRKASAVAMLRAWNLALLTGYPEDDTPESFVAFARDSRLTCEVMSVTLEQLEAINLPALIRLQGSKHSVWTAMLNVELGEFRIATGMQETSLIPREALIQCYTNEALIFWRDPAPNSLILKEGMSGEDVQVLQVQLRALGRLKQKPSAMYTKATTEAIQRIQVESGLNPDGAVGRQTRMVLYSWLPGFANPELRPLPPLLLGYDNETSKPETKPKPSPKADVSAEEKPAAQVAANAPAAPATPEQPAQPTETPPTEGAPPMPNGPRDSTETPKLTSDELAPPQSTPDSEGSESALQPGRSGQSSTAGETSVTGPQPNKPSSAVGTPSTPNPTLSGIPLVPSDPAAE